ncbi:MAG TPA: DUF417 family protein [Mycobacterium sp.]|uniref:YkgB family protein n=1 Tax=Mycobacterium sp. TaxID=1785 RepID=UPI002BFEB974|nr:DUF417 family protein [Mycobacterium sp.]HXO78815.1 DUF417 family protein [Mycobacterium sp.]
MRPIEDLLAAANDKGNSKLMRLAGLIARYGLVIILVWFGAMKFTYDEVHRISLFVTNSPLMSWVYRIMSIDTFGRVLGIIELITAALVAAKPWFPKASIAGGLLAVIFFAGTVSFMCTTPGVGEASAGGFPVLSSTGEFLMKDISSLGLSIWTLADALDETRRRALRAPRSRLASPR